MKILVIDDESIVRRALIKASQAKGHETKEAEDGESGLQLWREWEPDLVYLDVLMPHLSGPEVLKEIVNETTAKIVLISAYTGEYNVEKAQSMGADLFVAKPFHDIFNVLAVGEELMNGQ